jgi:hypothetical protein
MVKPRISRTLRGNTDLGKRAVELSHEAELELDDWQEYSLIESMRTRPDGRWAATEFGECVSRQNGKGALIEARLLASLDIVRSNLSIYSAHHFDTSLEHFRRLEYLITETPRLSKQLKGGSRGLKHSHGEEGIEFTGNRRIRFRTRTKGGGRGFTCDGVLVLDEAMVISEAMHGALFPVLSGKTTEIPGPQIWYLGSAVDQEIHEHGVVFARVRERGRGILGEAARLVYLEWSVEAPLDENDRELGPSAVSAEVAADRTIWAQANPALGIRINPDYIRETEFESMDIRTFAVERLGIGDWPRTDYVGNSPISPEAWQELEDQDSVLQDPICLAYDVSPDRRSSISAAGRNQDGLWHVEVIEDRPGTGWLPDRLAELVKRHSPAAVFCDGFGPAASLVSDIESLGIKVKTRTASEHAQACGRLVDQVEEKTIRHLPDSKLMGAIRAAHTRPLGDAWAWSRRNSAANISPLVSVTLALSAAMTKTAEAWVLVA